MLGKLLKYELKACGRTFIPLYIAILGISILNGLFVNTELFQIQGVGTLVLVGLFIALGILTVVVIIQRFRRNLLGDEGYLMLTLPVSTKSIILSKYIASIIYAILSCLVAIVSFQIIMITLALGTGSISEFLYEYKMIIASLFKNDFWKVLLFVLFAMWASYSIFILSIYTSISMGQLQKFNRHRNLIAFITFFIINIIISYAQDFISKLSNQNYNNIDYSNLNDLFAGTTYSLFIFDIMLILILFIGVSYILDKKLNIE